jgi:chemotaxis protein MotD
MMPGVAIQTGFPFAATSAARNAPPAADDRFSHTLHERPKAPAQDNRKTDHAADNSDGVRETAPRDDDGKEDKVGQSAHAKDDSSDNSGEKKKEDDRGDGALPPHMMAERTLAGQWADSAGASTVTADASAGAKVPAGSANATAPTAGGVQSLPSAGASGPAQPSTVFPMQGLPAQPPATVGKDGGTETAAPTQAKPAEAHPAPESVSVIATTTADAGKSVPHTSASMAKIVASQHEDRGSSPGTGKEAATPAVDAKADMATKIPQTAAGQGSSNTDADPDGQGGDGQPNKTAQNTAQLSSGTKGDTASVQLPTAQMVPSSGSATSFAGVLQQGGALARYSASAAAALAAGAPTNALPTQSLSIQLRPVELGSVTAHLKYAGSGLSIDIEVETPEAHRRLSNDSSDIVKSLQSLGFQVDKVTVRQALAQSQTQSQGQQQGQAQGQAMGRDGSASQGGSPFSMSGQSGGNGHRQGSESRYENASERGIGMVRETTDRVSRRGVFI